MENGQDPVTDDEPVAGQGLEVVPDEDDEQPAISEPGKLMRIALMLREMQEEVRRADMDAAGRDRLRIIHDRAFTQLKSVLSDDLTAELDTLTLPFDDDTPTESEIRVAQAQLIGWLEGLFQGIQAAIMNQQMAARQQLEQMRQRGLPKGPPGAGAEPEPGTRHRTPGQYL
jgi:hypothetical protein